MRLNYVAPTYSHYIEHAPGVARKVNSQIKSFNRAGIDAKLITREYRYSMLWKVGSRLPFFPDPAVWNQEDTHDCDVLYIRKSYYYSREFVNWLKRGKEENPSLRILLEIPTVTKTPVWKRKLRRIPHALKDSIHEGSLRRYVDRVVTFSSDEVIAGVPTIRIINGIDLDEVSVRDKASIASSEDEVKLVCAANFNEWHGIDRVLEGLANYYAAFPSRQVFLHLAGEGPEAGSLRQLSRRLGIQDKVVFHGMMSHEELDALYDQCDLGIECLGLHRIGGPTSSSLKSREYLAKGIPFVYSGVIDVLEEEPADFCLKCPADESPIDIKLFIQFLDGLYERGDPNKLSARIRSYAERHISIDVAMKPIIDYLEEEWNE